MGESKSKKKVTEADSNQRRKGMPKEVPQKVKKLKSHWKKKRKKTTVTAHLRLKLKQKKMQSLK